MPRSCGIAAASKRRADPIVSYLPAIIKGFSCRRGRALRRAARRDRRRPAAARASPARASRSLAFRCRASPARSAAAARLQRVEIGRERHAVVEIADMPDVGVDEGPDVAAALDPALAERIIEVEPSPCRRHLAKEGAHRRSCQRARVGRAILRQLLEAGALDQGEAEADALHLAQPAAHLELRAEETHVPVMREGERVVEAMRRDEAPSAARGRGSRRG